MQLVVSFFGRKKCLECTDRGRQQVVDPAGQPCPLTPHLAEAAPLSMAVANGSHDDLFVIIAQRIIPGKEQ